MPVVSLVVKRIIRGCEANYVLAIDFVVLSVEPVCYRWRCVVGSRLFYRLQTDCRLLYYDSGLDEKDIVAR